MPRTTPHPKPSKKRLNERLPGNERMALVIGLSLAGMLMLFFGLLIFSLQYTSAAPDPDAQTPVIKPDFPRQLVDFSLTGCAAVCPYVNAQMEKIQQLTAGDQDVKLISVTMDPVEDTAPILAHYGQTFHEDATRWSFLTGYEAEIQRLVGASFLPPDTTGEFSYMPGNFAHTQRIALVDARGHLVEYFDGLNQNAADTVAQEIAKLKNSSP